MLSPWIIRTLTLPPLLASLVPRNLRRYHTPTTFLKTATIYLPQNSHHTYLLWHFHSHFEIYCHATFHRSVYYDTHHHCHIALHDRKIASKMCHCYARSLHIPVQRRRHPYR